MLSQRLLTKNTEEEKNTKNNKGVIVRKLMYVITRIDNGQQFLFSAFVIFVFFVPLCELFGEILC
jgi:hypothetical protein